MEIAKWHLCVDHKNVRSTKPKLVEIIKNVLLNNVSIRKNKFYTKTIELKSRSYSDETGRFPIILSKGNKYIIIIYDYDSNTIIVTLLKIKSATE